MLGYTMFEIGVKMCWMQIKMDHPLAQHGGSLAPFRTMIMSECRITFRRVCHDFMHSRPICAIGAHPGC